MCCFACLDNRKPDDASLHIYFIQRSIVHTAIFASIPHRKDREILPQVVCILETFCLDLSQQPDNTPVHANARRGGSKSKRKMVVSETAKTEKASDDGADQDTTDTDTMQYVLDAQSLVQMDMFGIPWGEECRPVPQASARSTWCGGYCGSGQSAARRKGKEAASAPAPRGKENETEKERDPEAVSETEWESEESWSSCTAMAMLSTR